MSCCLLQEHCDVTISNLKGCSVVLLQCSEESRLTAATSCGKLLQWNIASALQNAGQ